MEWLFIIFIGWLIYGFLKDSSSNNKISYIDQDGERKTERLKRRQPRKKLIIEKPENFEITPEIQKMLNSFENTSNNFFLTGKAGTGKSTLLRYFRAITKKNYVVIAPTGIAAINVQGQTIHSFFGFGIDIAPGRVKYARTEKLLMLRKIETLIIDEISMVRADLLDCIDVSLRKNRRSKLPFGGVQVIAIGDPYQLPPIVKISESKYFHKVYGGAHFFNSKVYEEADFARLELTKIYRQEGDDSFIDILNSIRSGDLSQQQIDLLNKKTEIAPQKDSIKLVTTNALARVVNNSEMKKLSGTEKKYTAQIIGNFKEKVAPTEIELVLKEGARVMLLNNDKEGRWVNGDVGSIISLENSGVRVRFDDNTYDDVGLNEWDNIEFIYDEEKGKIEPEIVGKFIQLPIKLAWAITIHKSQGKTYSCVHIDFGTGTFAPGQAYVALSRCTSIQGLSFEAPMMIDDVLTDEKVKFFMGDLIENKSIKLKKNSNNKKIKTKKLEPLKKVSKSDLNKMNFFVSNPEKYATGTDKAKNKVEAVVKTFGVVKNTLDKKTIKEFSIAMKKYENGLNGN